MSPCPLYLLASVWVAAGGGGLGTWAYKEGSISGK